EGTSGGSGAATRPPRDPAADEAGSSSARRDPKAAVTRLVDALQDYLEVTAEKPQHEEPDGDEWEDDEEEERDMDGKPMSDREGEERYEFRGSRPRRQKRYANRAMMQRAVEVCTKAGMHCKALADMQDGEQFGDMHKTASMYHHKELMSLAKEFGGGASGNPPGETGQERPGQPEQDEEIDMDAIRRALEPVRNRVKGEGGGG